MVSKNVIEIIINARDMASNAIDNVNKSLKNMETTGKSSADQVTNSTSKLQTALDKVNSVASTVRNGFNTLGSAGKSALDGIWSALKNVASNITGLNNTISSLSPSFSNVAESIRNTWINMTTNLKGVWDSFTSGLGTIGETITNSLSGAGASISGLFESIRNEASSIGMSLSGVGEGLRESLTSAGMTISTTFESIRNEASSVGMSLSGVGEGLRESLSSASMSISGIFSSIRQEATSLGASISGAFSGIGSEISSSLSGVSSAISGVKEKTLGMAQGFSDVGNLISSKIGITGVNSVRELTVGLALSREKMTTLMRATMGSADAADALIKKWDGMTDNSVVSLDMMIGAFNKVKMSSGQSAEALSKFANSQKEVNGHSTNLSSTLIRLGEASILMGDDVGHAQFVMADAMDGLNGNFRTLQFNLGITKEKLLEQGWSGSKDDVEGYIAALNGCLDTMGDMSSVMDTNAGAIEKMQKAFRVAGRKIGEIITPIIGNLVDMFNWLDQVLDFGAKNDDGTEKHMHRLYTVVVLVFGALTILGTVLSLVALALKLYNGAIEAGIIADAEMITMNELLSVSFWQAAVAEHAMFFELLLAVAIIIAVVAALKYFYDNNETVRHAINVLAYELNNIFGRAWTEINKIIQPLIPTFQNLWNTIKYLIEVLTGTQTATDGASRGFDYLEFIIYSVGNVILVLVDVVVKLVEILLAILVPCINLIANILSAIIQFVIKLAQAFSLLMQGDVVGFFNALKDAFWDLFVNIGTYVGQFFLELGNNLWTILGGLLTMLLNWLSTLPGLIWGFLVNLPNLLYNLASGLLYALGFLLGLIWKYFTEWQPQMFAFIAGAVVKLFQLFIEKGIPAIIDFGQKCYVAIQDAFWGMIDAAKEIIPQLPQIIWDELVKIGEFIWNAGGMILAAIWGLCESLIQGFLDALGIHSPGTMATAIQEEMGHIPEFILTAIPRIVGAIVQLASNLLSNFRDNISKLPELIRSIFGDGAGDIAEWIINILVPAIDTLLLILQEFSIYLETVVQAVQLLLEGDFEGFFEMVINALMLFVSNVFLYLGQLLQYIWDWGVSTKDYVVQTAWNMVNGFIQWLMTLPGKAWTWLLLTLNNLINWGIQMKDKIVQTAWNMVNGFIQWISTLPGKAWTWLLNTINKIISFASSAPEQMRQAAQKIYDKFKEKVKELPQAMWDELVHIKDKILEGVGMVVDAVKTLGKRIIEGFKNSIDSHSPGLVARTMEQEMKYTQQALDSSNDDLYLAAKDVGKSILNGFNTNNMDSMSQEVVPDVSTLPEGELPSLPDTTVPQTATVQPLVDANQSQEVTDTVLTQNDMLTESVNQSTAQIDNNLNNSMNTLNNLSMTSTNCTATLEANNQRVVTSYTNMMNQVNTMLNNIIQRNLSGWTSVRNTTESNLNSMLSSTRSVTAQMVSAWNTMKNSIIQAAENIRSESTSRFDRLWSTIKTFYHNIQHPGGAGPANGGSHRTGFRTGFSSVGSALSTGLASVLKPQKKKMTQVELSSMGFTPQQVEYMIPTLSDNPNVKVNDVLKFFERGGAGWEDTVKPNTKYIKDVSSEWKMAGPVILGKYPTGLDIFKVKDFENGTPTISFDTFRRMAEAVFSQCHYLFYMDSDMYGSWQAAAYNGNMNCSDSIDFLIAMAHACGLSASKVHGYWNGIGHFWANVNGQKMDTTGWMLHRTWTPSQSHAGPSPYNETSNDDDEDDVTIIGLLLEIINILRGEQHMTVTHEGNVQYDFNHEITGDLPDGVTPEDVERIMDSHVEDSSFLKKISNNREFQERFDNMRRKLVRERERFS